MSLSTRRHSLKISLHIQEYPSETVLWRSQQLIYVNSPFRPQKDVQLLKLYLEIFDKLPVHLSNPRNIIYHACTIYYGTHPSSNINGHLIKLPLDTTTTFGPATPKPDGSFHIQYILLSCAPEISLPANLELSLDILNILWDGTPLFKSGGWNTPPQFE